MITELKIWKFVKSWLFEIKKHGSVFCGKSILNFLFS